MRLAAGGVSEFRGCRCWIFHESRLCFCSDMFIVGSKHYRPNWILRGYFLVSCLSRMTIKRAESIICWEKRAAAIQACTPGFCPYYFIMAGGKGHSIIDSVNKKGHYYLSMHWLCLRIKMSENDKKIKLLPCSEILCIVNETIVQCAIWDAKNVSKCSCGTFSFSCLGDISTLSNLWLKIADLKRKCSKTLLFLDPLWNGKATLLWLSFNLVKEKRVEKAKLYFWYPDRRDLDSCRSSKGL
jgi:hypothetical protein